MDTLIGKIISLLKHQSASLKHENFRHGNEKDIKRENVDLNENKLEDGDKRRKKNDKARYVFIKKFIF